MKRKKGLAVCTALLCLFVLPACGGKKENEAADERLSAPDYETQAVSQSAPVEEIQIVEGWEVHTVGSGKNNHVYVPHIENRVPGVLYWYDDEVRFKDYNPNRWTAVNRPEGTTAIKQPASGFWKGFSSQPKLGFDQNEKTLLIEPSFYLMGFHVYAPGNGGPAGEQQHAITSQDVQCISLALYEDFYERIPELTVKVYGLPADLWKARLGEDLFYENRADEKLLEQLAAADYEDCVLLSTSMPAETGVYYIDYRELDKQGDFMQYIIVFEFDRACEYTYQVDGYNTYNVTDEGAYQAWKEAHAAWFLAGR